MWLVTMCNRQPVYDGLRVSEVVVGLVPELFVAAFASANKTFKGLID